MSTIVILSNFCHELQSIVVKMFSKTSKKIKFLREGNFPVRYVIRDPWSISCLKNSKENSEFDVKVPTLSINKTINIPWF